MCCTILYLLISSVPYAASMLQAWLVLILKIWWLYISKACCVLKKGKTWQTSSQCSLWYWWYWDDIEPKVRAETESHFKNIATEISCPRDCHIYYLQGILTLILQTFSSCCGELPAFESNLDGTVTCITISLEVPHVLQDPCLQNPLWQSWVESRYRISHK